MMPIPAAAHIEINRAHHQPSRKYVSEKGVKVPAISRKMHTWSTVRNRCRKRGCSKVCDSVDAAYTAISVAPYTHTPTTCKASP